MGSRVHRRVRELVGPALRGRSGARSSGDRDPGERRARTRAPVGGHTRRLPAANLKELGPRGGHLRVLFAFDPRRVAILLLGGDKSGRWQAWYAETIPEAERLYSEHLAQLREERRTD